MKKLTNRSLLVEKVLFISVAVLISGYSVAQAADSSSGCGLGWSVTQKQSLVSSSIRSTTNTYLPNTFSMTSGTSGCAKHSIVKNDQNAVVYASNNVHSLVADMAKGEGEFLDGFAVALGCSGQSRAAFGGFVQSNFAQIQAASVSGDGVELYRAVRTQLESSPEFRGVCAPSSVI
jgi:hypothetical protein